MKKTIKAFLSASLLLVVGCGTATSVPDVDDNSAQSLQSNEEEKHDDLKEITIHNGDHLTISDGTDEIEVDWQTVEFEKEVYSNSDNKFAQYFPDKEDETYLVAKLKIKNIGGDNVDQSFFEDFDRIIEVQFDGKYKYKMQQLDTTSAVMSQFWSIQPLKNQEVYFVQSIPDEIIDKEYVLTFTVGNSTYKYVRDASDVSHESAADDSADAELEALTAQIKKIGEYLQEANDYSSKGTEYLSKVSKENNLGDMGYDIAQASVHYGQLVYYLQKAASESDGIEELEDFRSEVSKTIDMFPDSVEIKDKNSAAKYLENSKRFLTQYSNALKVWADYLKTLAE